MKRKSFIMVIITMILISNIAVGETASSSQNPFIGKWIRVNNTGYEVYFFEDLTFIIYNNGFDSMGRYSYTQSEFTMISTHNWNSLSSSWEDTYRLQPFTYTIDGSQMELKRGDGLIYRKIY
jgi:hypothetical protein